MGGPRSYWNCHITRTCQTWDYVHTLTQVTFQSFTCTPWSMTLDTKAKVLSKFGRLETMCVDGRSQKLLKLPHYSYMSNMGLCTHSHTSNFPKLICKLWINECRRLIWYNDFVSLIMYGLLSPRYLCYHLHSLLNSRQIHVLCTFVDEPESNEPQVTQPIKNNARARGCSLGQGDQPEVSKYLCTMISIVKSEQRAKAQTSGIPGLFCPWNPLYSVCSAHQEKENVAIRPRFLYLNIGLPIHIAT